MKNCPANNPYAKKGLKRLGRTPIYIIGMTFWWIGFFFVRELIRYPISQYLSSYCPFFVVFCVTFVTCFVTNIIELRTDYWKTSGYWRKYAIVNGVYSANVIVVVAITVTLDSFGLIDYFGACPASSFEMLAAFHRS